MDKKTIFSAAMAVLAVVAVFNLTGCSDDPPDGTDFINSQYISVTERQVYQAYYDQRDARFKYTDFLGDLIPKRKQSQMPQSGFFCDALDSLKVADYRAKKYHNSSNNVKNLSEMYQEIYGVNPRTTCGEAMPTPLPVPVAPSVVPMKDKGNVLSPAMYDELIKVANTCNRSRQHLVSLTSEKEYLTQEDYDEVLKSVMTCKKFKLEEELQK